jgi:hypothetical protein
MLIATGDAAAALREYQIFFQPSPSSSAVGYTLHVGREPGVYEAEFDLGNPPDSGGTVVYAVDLETAQDVFVALRAYDASGTFSPLSNEIQVAAVDTTTDPTTTDGSSGDPGTTDGGTTDPTTDPTADDSSSGADATPTDAPSPPPAVEGVVLALTADASGVIRGVLEDGSLVDLTLDSLAARRDLRPARCDLDADGDGDLLLGFGSGSDAQITLLYLEDGAVVTLASLQAADAAYASADGQTHLACGDVDGDGRAEIVVGFGGAAGQHVQILDDAASGFAPFDLVGSSLGMLAVPVPTNVRDAGAGLIPAVGDIDADGLDELVLGVSAGGNGEIVILDDAGASFAPHPALSANKAWVNVAPSSELRTAIDATFPSVGDFDGDGLAEIAIGFGAGSGGWIAFLDDTDRLSHSLTRGHLVIPVGRDDYRRTDGATRPSFADIDGDGRSELVVGFARAGASELQIFDDLVSGGISIMNGGNGFVSSPEPGVVWIPSPGL